MSINWPWQHQSLKVNLKVLDTTLMMMKKLLSLILTKANVSQERDLEVEYVTNTMIAEASTLAPTARAALARATGNVSIGSLGFLLLVNQKQI